MKFSTHIFKKILKRVRNPFRRLKIYIKHHLGWLGVPTIIAYEGYGNSSEVNMTGMVLEDKGLDKPKAGQSKWKNFLAALKRFSGDDIPGIQVKVSFKGESRVTETDEFGLFSVKFRNLNLKAGDKHSYQAELTDEIEKGQPKVVANAEVFVPSPKASYGVVSDIDDTILVSYASRTLKKLWIVLFKNALTRKSFEGFADLYQSLSAKGKEKNPVFYLSNSEWNLFDLLRDFREHNHFPRGPFLLRPMKSGGFKLFFTGKAKEQHKLEKIALLFTIYPDMRFVLVGDSGQHDPLVYTEMARKRPERIKAIFIRRISPGMNRKKLESLRQEMADLGIDMYLFDNTEEAREHARETGLL